MSKRAYPVWDYPSNTKTNPIPPKILAGTSPVKPDGGRPAGADKPDDGTGGQQRFAQRRKCPAELYVPDKGASDKQRGTAEFRQRKPDDRYGRDNRKNWNHKSGQANRGDRSKQTDRDSQVNGDDRETSLPFFVCQRRRYRRCERDHGCELVYRRSGRSQVRFLAAERRKQQRRISEKVLCRVGSEAKSAGGAGTAVSRAVRQRGGRGGNPRPARRLHRQGQRHGSSGVGAL